MSPGTAGSPVILHVTNGSEAAGRIADAGIEGDVLTWDDVLHDGPVPGSEDAAGLRAIRAAFIAERRWETRQEAEARFRRRDETLARASGETVLWFEHDLYDQLQLIQVLDRLADVVEPRRMTLVQADDYLGTLQAAAFVAHFAARRVVTEADLACAAEAWAAFGHEDPRWLGRLAQRTDLPLPHLAAALRRLLQQYPGVRDGLSRSERLLLAAVADGADTPAKAFLRSQRHDEPRFLGDLSFAWYIERLGEGAHPLIARADGAVLTAPGEPDPAFWHAHFALTDAGRQVLEGRSDQVALNGIERWYGGVHLSGRFVRWRWDEASGLVEAA